MTLYYTMQLLNTLLIISEITVNNVLGSVNNSAKKLVSRLQQVSKQKGSAKYREIFLFHNSTVNKKYIIHDFRAKMPYIDGIILFTNP